MSGKQKSFPLSMFEGSTYKGVQHKKTPLRSCLMLLALMFTGFS